VTVLVKLRQPRRETTIDGPCSVNELLDRFSMNRESFLVIRNGTLVPGDGRLDDTDVIEIRPVISGG
jgi:sulfur carrier protein